MKNVGQREDKKFALEMIQVLYLLHFILFSNLELSVKVKIFLLFPVCAVELRKQNGLTDNIIMGCKQRLACQNNKSQNFNQKRASDQKRNKHGNSHEWSGYQCKPLMLEKSTCRQLRVKIKNGFLWDFPSHDKKSQSHGKKQIFFLKVWRRRPESVPVLWD